MNDLKILTKRTWMLLLLSLVIVFGLVIFAGNYIKNASTWVQHPTNKHLYSNGRLLAAGTIYDRKGEVLCEARVVKVQNPKSFDHTPVVTIEIPKELIQHWQHEGYTHLHYGALKRILSLHR